MKHLVLCATLVLSLLGCSVAKQIDQAKAFAKCDFSLASADDFTLGGVKIDHAKSAKSLSMKKASKLMAAMSEKTVPLTFNLNILAKNPNKKEAGMNKLEWILHVDGREWTRGAIEDRFLIADSSELEFPIAINVDLKKLLQSESGESMMNLVFNLAGEGQSPTRFLIKAKPWIDVGGINIEYPGYIDIKASVDAEDSKKLRKKVKEKVKKKSEDKSEDKSVEGE